MVNGDFELITKVIRSYLFHSIKGNIIKLAKAPHPFSPSILVVSVHYFDSSTPPYSSTLMADALVSIVLERLASVLEQQVTLEVGVGSEVDNLNSTLQSIRAVLADAEKRQFSEELVKVWLERLKDISYQMDDVVDGWNTALLKLQIGAENPCIPKLKISSCLPSPCVCFKQVLLRCDIGIKIKDIRKQLDAIANERNQFNFVSSSTIQQPHRRMTSSVIDVSQFCGRDADIDVIIDKLLGGSSQESSSLYIISIVGMGGIGKTTFA